MTLTIITTITITVKHQQLKLTQQSNQYIGLWYKNHHDANSTHFHLDTMISFHSLFPNIKMFSHFSWTVTVWSCSTVLKHITLSFFANYNTFYIYLFILKTAVKFDQRKQRLLLYVCFSSIFSLFVWHLTLCTTLPAYNCIKNQSEIYRTFALLLK